MKKKIEFKNVEKVDGLVFKTEPSININKALQNGEIVFTTKHPKGVKRAEMVSSIPKIDLSLESVKKIASKSITDYDSRNKELIIEHSDVIEKLNQAHIDWIDKTRK